MWFAMPDNFSNGYRFEVCDFYGRLIARAYALDCSMFRRCRKSISDIPLFDCDIWPCTLSASYKAFLDANPSAAIWVCGGANHKSHNHSKK